MDLTEYAESLRRELTSITKFAGEDVAKAAELLAETLDSSVRLALLDVLSAAADEITARLDGATIDVRLSGAEPEFVVNMTRPADEAQPEPGGDVSDEAGSSRITLRLSDALKSRVEATAASAGMSVNAWLVRAISRSLDGSSGGPKPRPPFPAPPSGRPGKKRFTGFARS
jgi:hypothetical protein